MFKQFPVEYQLSSYDCGPASLKIIANHFGRDYSLQYLYDKCALKKEGISLSGLSTGAESIGLRTFAIKCTVEDVVFKIPLPAIIFWNMNHFVVVYNANSRYIHISDPAIGYKKYTHTEFKRGWYLQGENNGILLSVAPAADFNTTIPDQQKAKK